MNGSAVPANTVNTETVKPTSADAGATMTDVWLTPIDAAILLLGIGWTASQFAWLFHRRNK